MTALRLIAQVLTSEPMQTAYLAALGCVLPFLVAWLWGRL